MLPHLFNKSWYRFMNSIHNKWLDQAEAFTLFQNIIAVNDYYHEYLVMLNSRLNNVAALKKITIIHFLSK